MTIEQARGAEVRTQAEMAERLDRYMTFMISKTWLQRHALPPLVVLEHANEIHKVALMFRAEPPKPPVTSCSGTGKAGAAADPAASDRKPEWISFATASELSGLSESYVRRVCREREVATSRKAGTNAWLISASGWNAWMTTRKERI